MESPELSYLIGLLTSDGHMSGRSGHKGRIALELSEQDEEILYKLKDFIEADYKVRASIRKRTRDTNFLKEVTSSILSVCSKDFRKVIEPWIPYGSKKNVIAPAPNELVTIDYIRGLVDGDGSLGITSKNLPFISLTTSSESIKEYYLSFCEETTDRKPEIQRNERDNIYNICIFREKAQAIAKILYSEASLFILRKKKLAEEVRLWERPSSMKKVTQKAWTIEQDNLVLNYPINYVAATLNRTESSIKNRLHRLRHII